LATETGTLLSSVSEQFLGAIDWALAIAPQDRPQSVQALHDAFDGKVVPTRSSRQRSGTFVRVVTAPDTFRPLTTIRALRGRYAPTRLVRLFARHRRLRQATSRGAHARQRLPACVRSG